jgi:glycosyltransferase involved in cell wall biosynthesis
MRVLIPSLRLDSGIATYTLALARGLAAAGHEVVLLDESGGFEDPSPRIEVVPLRSPRQLPGPIEPTAEWGRIGDVKRIARERGVDGVHVTRLGLVPRGEKLVVTIWDPIRSPLGRARAATERGEPRVSEGIYALVDGLAAVRAKGIVAVTPAIRKAWARFARTELIPPFIDDATIGPARSGRPDDVIMVAGMLDLERKGLDLALESMAIVRESNPDARLVLVGGWVDDARRAALPAWCEAHGRLSTADLREAFAAAGCCVIPSRWEEFGYAGLEALAAGIPIATAPLPGYEGLSGRGVFTAPTRTAGELAAQVTAALAAQDFEFPSECRASNAIPKIIDLQRTAFALGPEA